MKFINFCSLYYFYSKIYINLLLLFNMSKISSRYIGGTQASQHFRSLKDSTSKYHGSVENLHNPYTKPVLLKLPKDKRLKKPSNLNMNLHMESSQHLPLFSDRVEKTAFTILNNTNRSTVFDNDSIQKNYRRSKCPGVYHSLSQQSRPQSAQKGTLQDIGANKNRKKSGLCKVYTSDPILISEPSTVNKPHLKTVYENPRAQRDKGERMRNNFVWEIKKTSTYLERYRASTRLLK